MMHKVKKIKRTRSVEGAVFSLTFQMLEYCFTWSRKMTEISAANLFRS